ncbi:uncharacterized protein TRIVIDRAFT_34768 [Trichoderma virens Gv29-8]|uniref:Ribonucleases P/MRP subunit Pop8-like domain-containing protein n=1 Tax=Hypocrea virens (strain Gv29-8 / FGSC 10586) TaxID=413071 RepID=G9MEE7_HYPVG|nr:uncharacterized protein TRIVIDRAFT_34768 [Trichoderma virens Gv29-8]EHK27430.1 hypothetical protein TRIVIDRAFT_34768 [Trichoderma virens Gv29-8]UKZ57890.1 hypothetical protein TrVGV298_011751 [Trichoderma virens]
MDQDTNPEAEQSILEKTRLQKSHELLTCIIRTPPFSYIHLELLTNPPDAAVELDNLQVKSYCTAALRQFLGLTGTAIPLDVLKVSGSECWIRVPREDLGSFAAALTAWKGTNDGGIESLLRIKQCSDWLGAMVGSNGQEQLWNN